MTLPAGILRLPPFFALFPLLCALFLAGPALAAEDAPPAGLLRAHQLLVEGRHDSSIAVFSREARHYREVADWARYVYCLNGVGENLVRTADFARARPLLAEADSIGRSVLQGRVPGLIRTLQLRGLLALYGGEVEESLSLFREAMDLTVRIVPGDTSSVVSALAFLASAEGRSGRYRRAEEHLQQALVMERSPLGRVPLLAAIARMRSSRGHYASAKSALLEAREILNGAPRHDPGAMISCMSDLSEVDFRLGIYASAVEAGEEALRRSREFYGDRHPATVNQMTRLGEMHAAAGRSDLAIAHLRQGIALYEMLDGGSDYALGVLHQRLASVYSRQGDHARALTHADSGLALARRDNGPDYPGNAMLHRTRADVRRALGDLGGALADARDAVQLFHVAGDSSDLGPAYTLLASIELERGMGSRALAHADTAIGHAGAAPDLAQAWIVRGEALLSLGRAAEARRSCAEGLHVLGVPEPMQGGSGVDVDLYGGRSALRALLMYSRASEAMADGRAAIRELKLAYEAARQAAAMLVGLRARYSDEQSKLELGLAGQPAFRSALRLALRMHRVSGERAYLDEAFQLAEAAKAGALIDAVSRAGAIRFSGVPPGMLERERSLRRELFACESAMADGERPDLAARRFELLRELDLLLAGSPEFAGTLRRPRPVSREEASRLIGPETALVEYSLLDSLLVAFVVTRDGFDMVTAPLPADLEASVRRYAESLRTFDVAGTRAQAERLGSLLLGPVAPHIAGTVRLIVVPADYLWLIPFETLLTRPSKDPAFTALPYLIRTHEVSYAYSATFLRETGAMPERRSRAFAGFAPAFAAETGALLALAGDAQRRGFGDLPLAGAEVEEIARSFVGEGVRGVTFTGAEATEGAFRRRAPEFGYLHIASHSFVDEANPSLNGVAFSEDPAGDGVLHAGEMFDLELHADLVVLSSCESGLGRMVPGEGLLAMTRGLFWSGSRNVVASLWDVYDAHASELMVAFYPALLAGRGIAASLRESKLAMIARQRTAFPGKWGGFVHIGAD